MKEVDKKDAPAISGGYTGPDSVITIPQPATPFPANPIIGTGEDELPTGSTSGPF